MRRRTILGTALASAVFPFGAGAVPARQSVAAGGMHFAWRHADDRLIATLTAPTAGWLAVGFNEERRLRGTRFVIAHVSAGTAHAELHLAQVPHHRNIIDLGGSPDLDVLEHDYREGISRLVVSLPSSGSGPHSLALRPGVEFHVMLAWSHARDFDHHSAWRGHLDIIL